MSLEKLFGDSASQAGLKLPPPCFEEMQAELLEYVDGQSMTIKFPVQERYQNPLGFMQGGFLLAAVDNTIGPLSYLVAPPSVTTTLNCTYLRPVPPNMSSFTVTGKVVILKVTSSSMVLEKPKS